MPTSANSGKERPVIDTRQRVLDGALKKSQYRQDALIEVLHTVQNTYGYLSPEHLWYVARQLKLPPSQVYGVATFYNYFTLKPAGAHTLVVCQGTACYIKEARSVLAAVEDHFGIGPGETTPDGQLSLSIARCFGSCSLAPAVILDGVVQGRVTPGGLIASTEAALAGQAPVAAPASDGAPAA